MKDKRLQILGEHRLVLSRASNCPRCEFGALALDPKHNVILMDGYNGGLRGGGEPCGGEVCRRDSKGIPSGERKEIGCHHAERNVNCNDAVSRVATAGAWMIGTGEPWKMCAKRIRHTGTTKVMVVDRGFGGAKGCRYLGSHGVAVQKVDEPSDCGCPRTRMRSEWHAAVVLTRGKVASAGGCLGPSRCRPLVPERIDASDQAWGKLDGAHARLCWPG